MPAQAPHCRQAILERLRTDLARLDRSVRLASGTQALGLAGIDRALPGGGLARAALHEFCGRPSVAAAGFAAALLGRFAAGGAVVWIGPRSDLFGPGLVELGLQPASLIMVRARQRSTRLWALEEALRSSGVAAALAEVDALDLTQGRRLQIAAESGGAAAMLLRPAAMLAQPSVAVTRWRIGAQPEIEGAPSWQVELVRARGGRAGCWRIAWRQGSSSPLGGSPRQTGSSSPQGGGPRQEGWYEVTGALAVAADAPDRPAAATGAR